MSLIQLQTLLVIAFVFHQNHGLATHSIDNHSVDTPKIESKPKAIPKQFRISVSSNFEGRYVPVTFTWESVQREDFNGNAKGYNIHCWNANNLNNSWEYFHEYTSTSSNEYKTLMHGNTLYYATIQVVNEKYFGPPSNIIEFKAPETLPEQIKRTEATPFGSTAFKLKWDAPEDLNGQILGYNIYYSEINSKTSEQRKIIHDSSITETKIVELKPSTRYQFRIAAWSKAGEAKDSAFELRTNAPTEPWKPSFSWEPQNKTIGYNGFIQVNWKPQIYDGKSGSTFYVKYHIKNSVEWKRTPEIIIDDYAIINLETYETYEVSIVSVDGEYERESDIQIISKNIFEGIDDSPSMWVLGIFIVVCSAVVVLGLLWLLKKCYEKKRRNRNSV